MLIKYLFHKKSQRKPYNKFHKSKEENEKVDKFTEEHVLVNINLLPLEDLLGFHEATNFSANVKMFIKRNDCNRW